MSVDQQLLPQPAHLFTFRYKQLARFVAEKRQLVECVVGAPSRLRIETRGVVDPVR
jgi:hypothetical protein